MKSIVTDGTDERFISLCRKLDEYLNDIVGGNEMRDKYDQYNTLEDIHDVVLLLRGETAIACGSFKEYMTGIAEIKRVFVSKEYRQAGCGRKIMEELEALAKEKGYRQLILETGKPLEGAMKLYKRQGFHIIDNYGQYADMPESICMQKSL
jgi:putative acetyltransferase